MWGQGYEIPFCEFAFQHCASAPSFDFHMPKLALGSPSNGDHTTLRTRRSEHYERARSMLQRLDFPHNHFDTSSSLTRSHRHFLTSPRLTYVIVSRHCKAPLCQKFWDNDFF
jgi:hypothetical protein